MVRLRLSKYCFTFHHRHVGSCRHRQRSIPADRSRELVRGPSAVPDWCVGYSSAGTPPTDAFAGVITGLTPGTSYTVRVAIRLGESSVTTMLTAVTRPLPGPAGTPTKVIAAGLTSSQIQAAFSNSVGAWRRDPVHKWHLPPVDDLLVKRSRNTVDADLHQRREQNGRSSEVLCSTGTSFAFSKLPTWSSRT